MLKLFLILIGILVIGGIIVGAVNISFNPDSKVTKIATAKICQAEMLSTIKFCNEDTPDEIDVDFDKDSKTGQFKVDANSIFRSLK